VRLDEVRKEQDFPGVLGPEKERRDIIGQAGEVQRAAPLDQPCPQLPSVTDAQPVGQLGRVGFRLPPQEKGVVDIPAHRARFVLAASSKIGTEGIGAPIQARFLLRALRTGTQSMTVPPASR